MNNAPKEELRLGGLISYLLRAQSAFYSRRLKEYDISSGQFPFLKALYREDGINQETLAKRLLFNKATIARAVNRLEREGYVYRTGDEYDGRANRIYLTERGRRIQPAMDRLSREWNAILLAGFTDVERMLQKELIKKIVANVMREMEQEDLTVLMEMMK